MLERDDGTIAVIEVKAAATETSRHFAGLRTLAEACKERFTYGVVLYNSADFVPFGDKLAARQAVERLAGEILLNDLALEGDAVGAVSCHGRRSFECPANRSNHFNPPVRPQGPTPLLGQSSKPIDRILFPGRSRSLVT